MLPRAWRRGQPVRYMPLQQGQYLLVTATFTAPASCLSAGERKDACMRAKDVLIRLPLYNLQRRILLFVD